MAAATAAPLKRATIDTSSYDRATWCSDYGVPCRLVQYSREVITEACNEYLGDNDSAAAAVTVTEQATTQATVTVTQIPSACGTAEQILPTAEAAAPEELVEEATSAPLEDTAAADADAAVQDPLDTYYDTTTEDTASDGAPNYQFEDGNDYETYEPLERRVG